MPFFKGVKQAQISLVQCGAKVGQTIPVPVPDELLCLRNCPRHTKRFSDLPLAVGRMFLPTLYEADPGLSSCHFVVPRFSPRGGGIYAAGPN